MPDREFTIFDFAYGTAAILEKLNVKKCSIIAHSFGARVAFILASQCNIKIEKMVLFGPAGIKPRFSFKRFAKQFAYKTAKKLSKLRLYPTRKLSLWGSEDYKKLSPAMKKTFINVVSCDLKIFLSLINAKTLVIIGKNDKETPVYMGKVICKKIKNSILKVVDNCGHFCFLEKTDLIKVAYNFIKC